MPFLLLSSAQQDRASSRTFQEFASKEEFAKTLITCFEDYLQVVRKASNDESDEYEYASEDLIEFVDTFFAELVCLEQCQTDHNLWIPHSTPWVKESIYLYLRTLCKNDLNDDQIMEIAID